MRLRRVSVEGPGITRSRRARGFHYRDARGRPVDGETRERIRALAIPPAWTDVWISPDPHGHIQAVGTDAAGRRQYRYHDAWRVRRDAEKFDRMIAFAKTLPRLRRRVSADLRRRGVPREKALACAVRLMDRAFFRIGSEEYASRNGSFGLATLRKEHVRVDGERVRFDFAAKGGARRVEEVRDAALARAVAAMKRRRSGGDELLAYLDGDEGWRDVRSADINAYLREIAGDGFSAKDFRTWHATVLAAVSLAGRDPGRASTSASLRREVAAAVREVAEYLGNTPAVARASYVDPRVVDRYERGETIAKVLRRTPVAGRPGDVDRERIERVVLDLISEEPTARAA